MSFKNRFTLVLLCFFLLIAFGSVQAANLNLRATWTPNTETDMRDYLLYRTDGSRVLLGTIVHPTAQFDFTVTVPDNQQGTMTFVLQARDTNNNVSADSVTASYIWNSDAIPPAPPGVPTILKQVVISTNTTVTIQFADGQPLKFPIDAEPVVHSNLRIN